MLARALLAAAALIGFAPQRRRTGRTTRRKEAHGHFTHYYAAVWKPYLIEFMKTLGPSKAAAK